MYAFDLSEADPELPSHYPFCNPWGARHANAFSMGLDNEATYFNLLKSERELRRIVCLR